MTARPLVRSALALVLFGLALPSAALAGFPGKNGKIAFVERACCEGYPASSIYTVNPDGSELTKLPDSDLKNLWPRWSADGKKIVFYSDHVDYNFTSAEIWTMNADGSDRKQLTHNTYDDTFPTWSPDGTKIAFMRRTSTRISIYVMNSDGSNQSELPDTEGGSRPAWSPDGKQIAFLRPNEYHEINHLALISASGGDATTLPLYGLDVAWSPDGSRIASTLVDAFTYWPGRIYLANGDGTFIKTISPATSYPDGPLSDRGPAWSPDGEKIAFENCEPCDFDTGMQSNIATMNADGTGRTAIATANSGFVGDVDWQPIPGPNRGDYKNGPAFCRAQREFLGSNEFTARYGGGRDAFGKCVSQSK